jgi:hypothetical protein
MNFTPSEWMVVGLVMAAIVWFVLELRRAPIERNDMTRSEQEDAAEEAADSMRGQLDGMRDRGLL